MLNGFTKCVFQEEYKKAPASYLFSIQSNLFYIPLLLCVSMPKPVHLADCDDGGVHGSHKDNVMMEINAIHHAPWHAQKHRGKRKGPTTHLFPVLWSSIVNKIRNKRQESRSSSWGNRRSYILTELWRLSGTFEVRKGQDMDSLQLT